MQVIPRSELRRLQAEAALGRRLAEENGRLRTELKAALATIATLNGKVTGLMTLGDNLQQQMAELKAKLGTNSQNSSKPPSSDGPEAPKRPERKRTGRRRGGQPGHKGAHRPMVAAEDVDEAYSMWPDECAGCKAELSGDDPDPLEHQVVEIPDPKVVVTSYLLHALACAKCGKVTRAELPEGVSESGFGPRVHAMAATWVGKFRQSKRSVVELFKLVWDLDVSTGGVSKMEKRVAAMLGPPVAEIAAYLQLSKSAHGDETGWRERLRRSWLWVGATCQVAVFLIRTSRGGVVARELFGPAYAGTICTDRWSAYNAFALRALCWAHLLRDFTAMVERHKSPWHGHRLGLLARAILGHWQSWANGEIDRATLTALTIPLRTRFETVLGWTAKNAPGPKAQGIARDLLGRLDELWRFLDDPLVHPTNNLAERLLRYAVIYRKLSFGTDSAAGSRYIERLLSTAATLSLQNRNLFAYLTEGMTAHFAGKPAPSLLPVATEG
jgi:transposase